MHLRDKNLPALAARADAPTYDRQSLEPSVVHIGVGGFHRAHQAVYLDTLARQGETRWAEVGVGLRSPRMRTALVPQDCLFTVTERSAAGDNVRLVGSMVSYHYGPDDPTSVLAALTKPCTRLVTLTVTGNGYNLDENGTFRSGVPEVVQDLKEASSPKTWFGFVVAALGHRRAAGLPPFTVLSCDNLAESGAAARAAVVSFARLKDELLAAWIERNVAFPDSMVDRITPQPNDDLRVLLARQFGIIDRSPVPTEPYCQWVIEDAFSNGRPPLEEAGADMVASVGPYKKMKGRLLNGGHSAIAYLGYLGGHRTTSDVMSDPVMAGFLTQLMRVEVGPLLPSVSGVSPRAYQSQVLDRLANPRIADPLTRLCGRGSTKMPAYLLPSLHENLTQGRRAPLLTLAVAAWFRYLRGTDMAGAAIDIHDARAEPLQRLARLGGPDPSPLLSDRRLMGSLTDDRAFGADLARALRDLDRLGPKAAVQHYLARRVETPITLTGRVASRTAVPRQGSALKLGPLAVPDTESMLTGTSPGGQ